MRSTERPPTPPHRASNLRAIVMKYVHTLLLASILLLGACSSSRETAGTAELQGTETGAVKVGPNESVMDVILRTPGVYLTPSGQLRIRGSSTPPLIVVDGIITGRSLGHINPEDVDTVRVLKGPETAIYGFRGGAGVIEITTKRGGSR